MSWNTTQPTTSDPEPASQRDRNRARTRRDIEAAALKLFEDGGFQATTVEQITRRAGVSSATFFRHFKAKEDVLFANDEAAVEELVKFVTARVDKSATLAALADPVASFAKSFLMDATSEAQRLTRLVMTTRDLEARSLRMRLLWEHALTRSLAAESHYTKPQFDHVLLAGLAVSCLSTALWEWQQPEDPVDIVTATKRAFNRAHLVVSSR
ncbi:TetR/AcrR family transcriptional regulator [Rhodococcoides fascians]|uniref:TetR/AcrR family transcriptional regulator n=1 Tax=Rhodococcoides fascians TaxID=1828 RepID=UPI00068C007B|nr:TetR/AcrR family transcriptional regulator [Rhodococcus fascians]